MTRPLRSTQADLFSTPTVILPLSLTAKMREELVNLVSVLLLEVMSYLPRQPNPAQQEYNDEQQDHA